MSQVNYSWVYRFVTIVVALLASGAIAHAQDQYALLSHQGETTVFRGSNALIDAANKAEEGDIITLSEGQFKGTLISRNITLRGAGMGINGDKTTVVTYNKDINGEYENYSLRVASPEGGGILVENLSCGGSGIVIQDGNAVDLVRCNAQVTFGASNNNVKEMRIINCVIPGGIDNRNENNPPLIIGSVINGRVMGIKADHCVLIDQNGLNVAISDSSLSNSVVFCSISEHNSVWINCVVITSPLSGPYAEMITKSFMDELEAASQTNKVYYDTETDAFKEGSTLYELTDENAASWLCEDGTQVGIYGGSMPFSSPFTFLTIKTLKVAERTDSEGMLKLEVEIE